MVCRLVILNFDQTVCVLSDIKRDIRSAHDVVPAEYGFITARAQRDLSQRFDRQ